MNPLAAALRFWQRLRCVHYFATVSSEPSAEGVLVKRKCTRCDGVEWVLRKSAGRNK